MNRKRSPSTCNTSSTVSRVVPGISDTIARSSSSSMLSSDDLPTFGLPAITTGMPFLITLPSLNEEISLSTIFLILMTVSVIANRSANCTSSSLKSSSSSIREAKVISSFLSFSIPSEKPPRNCVAARRCDAAESAAIRSATASACERSILPFMKALRVNSPGMAGFTPRSISNSMILCWM